MPYHHLSRNERGKIAFLYRHHVPISEIARRMDRSASTISREIARNKQGQSYRAQAAQISYVCRRTKCHRKRLYEDPGICDYVTEKLMQAWSPEQIAGRMDFKKSKKRVSFSSIYRWLHQGLMPQAIKLSKQLRGHKKHGQANSTLYKSGAKELKTRCKSALKRRRFGDWEVDTIVFGQYPTVRYLLGAVERKSRYCCLILLRNIKREEVMRAFKAFFEKGRLPLRTMTSDRGMEFNCHNEFEEAFGALYYYTDKASPWQKPTVENTNGLIRQFLPRGTKVSEIDPDAIPGIMSMLNNRPRKCLGFKTPAEALRLT